MLSTLARASLLSSGIWAALGAGHEITYSGYLVDYLCLDRVLAGGAAPDGSNIMSNPAGHKVGCLLLDGSGGTPACEPSGYYIAEDCGGNGDNYHPKFSLDADSHANAVAYLTGLNNNDMVDVKVTVSGHVHDGILENASFATCTGSDCDGVCSAGTCTGLMDSMCDSDTVTYSGYIVDWYCYGEITNNGTTPDGSDVVADPSQHTLGCLTGPADCYNSGYYLAKADSDGHYHPEFNLMHASSHATVLAYLNSLTNITNDVKVTVTGKNVNGVIQNAAITLCTTSTPTGNERGCDGVCTGACTYSLSNTMTTTATSMDGGSSDDAAFARSFAVPSVFLLLASFFAF